MNHLEKDSEFKKGEEVILVSSWTNPSAKKVYYLFQSQIHEAVTEDLDVLEFSRTHSDHEVLSHPTYYHSIPMVWRNQLIKNDKKDKIWKRISKKIKFYKERESLFKKYFKEYWDFYEKSITNPNLSTLKIVRSYYLRKLLFLVKTSYLKGFAPLLYLLTHDLTNLWKISSRLQDAREDLKLETLKIVELEHSWFYSDSEKSKLISDTKASIIKKEETEEKISKSLSEINKNLITIAISACAVFISFFTAYEIYIQKNKEIGDLKSKILELSNLLNHKNSEIEFLLEQNRIK